VPATNDGRIEAMPYRNPIEGRPGGARWLTVSPLAGSPLAGSDAHEIEVDGRVLVVAGEGADPGVVAEALAAGCVVVAEGHSGCRIAGTVTVAHHLLASARVAKALRPDRVVTIGRAGLSPNVAKLVASVDGVGVGRGWFDPARRLTHLFHMVGFAAGDPDRAWASTWENFEAVARRALDQELDASDSPSEPRTARDTAGMVAAGGTLVVASSMPVRDLDWFAMAGPSIKVISNRGASGIDGLVSLALGAAAAGPTIALVGDLSLLHDQNGFLVTPRPDLTIVVVNNDGGGIFSFLPQAGFAEFERLFGTPTGMSIARLAELHGLGHTLVDQASALQASVAGAQASGGVHLIEVKTNRDENVELHRRLTRRVIEAIEPLVEG
jgi:2-succinyl-5-enolpyruvyl-6-hydroxy-3-cyclohexene-1-carboxylate synthase